MDVKIALWRIAYAKTAEHLTRSQRYRIADAAADRAYSAIVDTIGDAERVINEDKEARA